MQELQDPQFGHRWNIGIT